MYKIIGADQREYGPVSLAELRLWIAEGRANAQTAVRLESGGDWKPLAEHPELNSLLSEIRAAGAVPPPASGHGTLPPDILQRDYDLNIGSCLSRAFQLLMKGNSSVLAGVALYVLIQLGIMFIAQIPFVGAMVGMASLFVTGPLLAGVNLFVLRNLRGESVRPGEIFGGFGPRYFHLLIIYLIEGLITGILILPGLILIIVGLLPLFIGDHQLGALQFCLIGLGGVVLVVPPAYLSVIWMFALTLAIDKRLDFWPAMETSRKVVNKHWWHVFALIAIGGTIGLTGLLLCCVPVFLTAPFVFSTLMYAYEDIFAHRPAASETVARH